METKKSKIEMVIDEIEDYIESCKFATFSNNKIIVNKDEIDTLIMELRRKTPEEIKQYQKVVANRDRIIEDARNTAQDLINKATVQTNELISEHEIMQRAYDQANEIVALASSQAQEIIDGATIEANEVKASAIHYTDSLLAHVEEVASHYLNMSNNEYNSLINGLRECVDVVRANRSELNPQPVAETPANPEAYANLTSTGSINSSEVDAQASGIDLNLI